MTEKDREKKLREAYTRANTRLRVAHQKEFNQYRIEEAERLGIELSLRPTKEEKARADLKKLLAENPDLEAELTQQVLAKQVAD